MKVIEINNNYNVIDLGGDFALMPDINNDQQRSNDSKVVILNKTAMRIYTLLKNEKDSEKVIDLLKGEYGDDDNIHLFVKESLNKLIDAKVFKIVN